MQHAKPRYSINEAFGLLKLSRTKGYKRIRDGSLRTVLDGSIQYITAAEIDRYASEPHGPVDYTPRQKKGRAAPRREQRAT